MRGKGKNIMKTKAQLEDQASSVMRFLEGEEVIAYIDWDSTWYYVWLEPTWAFEDFCEEHEDCLPMLENLREELDRIGVQNFGDLDGVNRFLRRYCGDDEPAEFYLDEYDNVVGV